MLLNDIMFYKQFRKGNKLGTFFKWCTWTCIYDIMKLCRVNVFIVCFGLTTFMGAILLVVG